MLPLERNRQRASELLARCSQPRGLDVPVIPRHQFLGVGMEVHLPVHPLRDRMSVEVMLKQRQGYHQRQQPLAVVLNEAQELQPTEGRPCLRSTVDSSGSPSGVGARSHAWPRSLRLQPITVKHSFTMASYWAIDFSQSRLRHRRRGDSSAPTLPAARRSGLRRQPSQM